MAANDRAEPGWEKVIVVEEHAMLAVDGEVTSVNVQLLLRDRHRKRPPRLFTIEAEVSGS